MEIVLIRHAQSANNKLWDDTGGSVGRSPDPELTDLGVEQADALRAWLETDDDAPRLTHLHSSYMWRAVQTAAPIAAAFDLDIHGHLDIHELGGPYDYADDGTTPVHHPGSTPTQLGAITARLVAADLDPEVGWWTGPYEEWESAPERAARVVAGLIETYAEQPDAVVGVVTHGLFTQYLIRTLLGADEMTGWIHIDNTGVSRFVHDPRGWVATVINGVDHLRREQRSS